MKCLTFGSLFAGIGGIDLGLERAGMVCKWQVENDKFCIKVLEKHWPQVARYGDIKDCQVLEYVDVIAGGFPCQDISNAGKRKGITGSRSSLWNEMARLVSEIRPRYVLVENVSALLGRGIDTVLGDLAALRYDAEWDCIPASALGAPHRRDRVFIVAYAQSITERKQADEAYAFSGCRQAWDESLYSSFVAHPVSQRRQEFRLGQPAEAPHSGPEHCCVVGDTRVPSEMLDAQDIQGRQAESRYAGHVPHAVLGRRCKEAQRRARLQNTQEGGCWFRDPAEEDPAAQSFLGRVAHGIPNRVDRIKSLGNAVVPQVAEFIGRRIVEFDRKLMLCKAEDGEEIKWQTQ